MGLGGISIWQLLIILLIVIMLFGTRRLKSLGGDLGHAIKSFRKSMQDEDNRPSVAGSSSSESVEKPVTKKVSKTTSQQDDTG